MHVHLETMWTVPLKCTMYCGLNNMWVLYKSCVLQVETLLQDNHCSNSSQHRRVTGICWVCCFEGDSDGDYIMFSPLQEALSTAPLWINKDDKDLIVQSMDIISQLKDESLAYIVSV
jgi:hypothetical protein